MSDQKASPDHGKKASPGKSDDTPATSKGSSPNDKRATPRQKKITRAQLDELINKHGWLIIRQEVVNQEVVRPGHTIHHRGQRYRIVGCRKVRDPAIRHRSPANHLPQGDLFGKVEPSVYELVLAPLGKPKATSTPPPPQRDNRSIHTSPFEGGPERKQGDPPQEYSQQQIEMIRHVLKYEKFLQDH